MSDQPDHPMMAKASHDEFARQAFVTSLKRHISATVTPGNKVEMETRAIPAFEKRHKRAPNSRQELRKAMERGPHHRMWGSLMRCAQELMWDSVEDTVDRQLGALIAQARGGANPLGSLRLDPGLEIPRYLAGVDIHCMPGGYHTEVAPDDVRAGAIYDRGAFLYHLGQRGMDDNGRLLVAFVGGEHPGLAPRRILDMGCTVGHATTAFCDFFPDAEIHAIDIGAPLVRYAHARAEAMGRAIHYAQANAEATDFADGSFDLVVSSNLMHETSMRALPRILAECRRILRPGGVMAHMEVPVRYKDMALYDQVMRGWQTHYNAEPFWDAVCSTDLVALARKAGLKRVRDGYLERTTDPVGEPRKLLRAANQGNNHRYLLTAVK
jgi:2-polyprenyl-3-methyl-5-hydroxy-6-metoxy-1,4-benzoquinol methylase